MTIMTSAGKLAKLMDSHKGCVYIATEITVTSDEDVRLSGLTISIWYRGSMAMSDIQGCRFSSYFASNVVLVNMEGKQYHIPDCEEFHNWVDLVVPMIDQYAELDLWNM